MEILKKKLSSKKFRSEKKKQEKQIETSAADQGLPGFFSRPEKCQLQAPVPRGGKWEDPDKVIAWSQEK